MPYCRKCGAPLKDEDRFCPKCGTQTVTFTAPTPPQQPTYRPVPIRKDPLIVVGIVLIAILVVAVFAIIFLFAPVGGTWNVNQSLNDQTANVHTLNLNFDTDVGQVNVVALKVAESNVGIYIVGNGSRGAIGGNNPVSVTFENATVGNTLTVNSKINVETASSRNIKLDIQIFVDPALKLNLNITSHAGQVSFNADKAATIQSLALTTNAGTVDATLQNVTLTNTISLTTNAGTINYRSSNINIAGNATLNLHTYAGTVRTDITQAKTMGGNMQINAKTELGSVDLNLAIDGDVAAKITAQTSLGSVHLNNAHNFHGERSPIQSNNYPATDNFDINLETNLGSVNIDANYLNNQASSTVRN